MNRELFLKSALLGIKIFLLVIIYPQITGAALIKPVALGEKTKGPVPDSLIYFQTQNPGYALLVEKSTQKAYLYQANNIDRPLKAYSCSTGENKGPKSTKDDKRTPEGVYFVTNSFKDRDLPPIYGALALAIDYPNPRDRKLGRKGYGIWLHGTNESLKPRDSNGCIVFRNEDIIELSGYIGEGHAPIIITQKINLIEKKRLQKERAELKGFIMDWLAAWRQGNIDLYMSFYYKGFTAAGKNWHQWRAYKRRLSEGYGEIDINIDNLHILKRDGIVLAKFDQTYRANGFFSLGEKRLYLEKKGPEWKILDEFFKRAKVSAQKVPPKPRREEEFFAIKRLISNWQKAWQEKDLQGYIASYSEDFFSHGLDRDGWKRHKSKINKRYGQIRVTISNLKIRLISSERATVHFEQDYSSDKYYDRGRKTIQLIKRDGKWKIKTETWVLIRRGKRS
ncbi:MAG: L,D-transpeptidase family protein [Desulfatiglandales bacterium]